MLAAVIGGVLMGLGWIIVTIYANRRERQEFDAIGKARAREALTACKNLRYLLEYWLDQIDEKTKFEGSTEETLTKLKRFQEGHFFQTRLKECSDSLRAAAEEEPECHRLLVQMDLFDSRDFELKGRLQMALVPGKFQRNYDAHREEARQAIAQEYNKLV